MRPSEPTQNQPRTRSKLVELCRVAALIFAVLITTVALNHRPADALTPIETLAQNTTGPVGEQKSDTNNVGQLARWLTYSAVFLTGLALVLARARKRLEKRAELIRTQTLPEEPAPPTSVPPKPAAPTPPSPALPAPVPSEPAASEPVLEPEMELKPKEVAETASAEEDESLCVIFDAAPVLFGHSGEVEKDLLPFIRANLGECGLIELERIHNELCIGKTTTAQLWKQCNIIADAEALDPAFINIRRIAEKDLAIMAEMAQHGAQLVAISDDPRIWAQLTKARISQKIGHNIIWFDSETLGTTITTTDGQNTFFKKAAKALSDFDKIIFISPDETKLTAAALTEIEPVKYQPEPAKEKEATESRWPQITDLDDLFA